MSSVDFISGGVTYDRKTAIMTTSDLPLSAADVSLPPVSPSEEAALDSRDVSELSAFVEKKNWIEEKIEFLRGLRRIDCFIAMIPSFPDTQSNSILDSAGNSQLPTYEDLEDMYDEQDRIEEEAMIFDAGDLVELRQMARAASKKSLSREDTDLLSITLSTLYLLDTLMHLLRARADTIDLLSYRLEWDTMRFALAKEFLALEQDMKTFIKEKARWSTKAYDAPSYGNGITHESNKSRDSAAIGKGTSRSQRILFAQILELDFQSFRNRIASLRYVSIPQLDKSLTGMIDQAARLQSYHASPKSSSLNSSQRSSDRPIQEKERTLDEVSGSDNESQGAVPNFFLDEQDNLEERVGVLEEWESFLRGCVQQWKHVDKSYHSLRKILMEIISLSNDIRQSISLQPSIELSNQYSDRVSAVSSELSEFTPLRNDPLFLCLSHPAFPDQKESHTSVVSLMDAEIDKNKQELSKVRKLVNEYNELAELVDRLNKAKNGLEELIQILKKDTQFLLEGSDQNEGGPVDFSDISCLQPGSYAAYIAQLPRISTNIDYIRLQSAPHLKEISILLLVLRDCIGVDAAFRSSVEATSDSFQESLSAICHTKEAISKATELLIRCRDLDDQLNTTASTIETLHRQLSNALEQARWNGLNSSGSNLEDGFSIASFNSRLLDLQSTLSGSLAASLARLSSSLSPSEHRLKNIIQHISSVFESLCAKSDTLRDLFLLLSLIEVQTREMNAVNEEAQKLFGEASLLNERMSSVSDLIINGSPPGDHLVLLSESVSSFTDRTKIFISSISQRIPLVSPPNLLIAPTSRAGSITPEIITSSSPPESSDSQSSNLVPPFAASFIAQDVVTKIFDSSSVDYLVRADANTLAARLTSVAYDAEKRLDILVETANASLAQLQEATNLENPRLSSQVVSSPKCSPALVFTTMEDEMLNIERHLKNVSQPSPSIHPISSESSSKPTISQSLALTKTETMSEFKKTVARCDSSLSALLDSVDLVGHRSPFQPSTSRVSSPSSISLGSLEATFSEANVAFQLVLSASKDICKDRRVASEVNRLTTAMEEMRDIVAAKIETSTTTSGRTSRMSMREDPDSDNDSRSCASLSRSCSAASMQSVASSRSSRSGSHNSRRSSLTHAKLTTHQSRLSSLSLSSELPDLFSSKPRISRSSSASSFVSFDGHALSPTISSASKSRVNGESPFSVPSPRRHSRSTLTGKHTTAPSRKTLDPSNMSPPPFPAHQLSPPPNRTNSSLPVSSRYKSPPSQINKTLHSGTGPVTSSQYKLHGLTTSIASVGRQKSLKSYHSHQDKPIDGRIEDRAPTARRKPPVPKKDDTLDRAINKIVNDMKVEIPIEPHVRSDGVTEAGKYWIGIPPKLCFCRILRSKTVMVRVGGGWVELSKFLQDHFGYELPSNDSLPLSPALPEDVWPKGSLNSLSSPTVSTPRKPDKQLLPLPSSHRSMTLSPSLPPHTPKRDLRDRREGPPSPHPPTFITPRTIVASVSSSNLKGDVHSSPAHPNSPGSPLVSLNVITRYNPGELSPSTPKSNSGRKHSPSPRSSLEPILGLGIRVPKPRLSSTNSVSSLNGDQRKISQDAKAAM